MSEDLELKKILIKRMKDAQKTMFETGAVMSIISSEYIQCRGASLAITSEIIKEWIETVESGKIEIKNIDE